MITPEESDRLTEEMNRMSRKLGEMGGGSVVIMTTFQLKGGMTGSRISRHGNYWAQRGFMQGWIDHEKQGEQAEFIADAMEEEE